MKASEAPNRLYLSKNIYSTYLYQVPDLDDETAVEYTRTDAFIEKALKWYCLDCECNDNCKADYKCFFRQEYKRYLEGNNNAILPKFDNAINPDGSTTENYRYRHFIRRMQDTFIEKARKWFELQNEGVDSDGNYQCDMTDFEDFKRYMEGE